MSNIDQISIRGQVHYRGMSGSELDDDADRTRMNLHTTAQIEERFRKVFKREMTREERRAFFIPDDEPTNS